MLRPILALLLLPASLHAEVAASDLRLVAAFPTARSAAIYGMVTNDGPETLRLIAVESDAGMTMLHETVDENGVTSMRPVTAVRMPPGSTLTLAPGGVHLMVMGLAPGALDAPLADVTLVFEDGTRVAFPVKVRIGPDDETMHGTEGHTDAEHGAHGSH